MKLETFFENFELLADAPNGVQKLREVILQLAVRGKLVPQDPTDEQASVLLEKIKAKKEWLIEKKKIRKDKPLAPIEASELPYDLPAGWNWARLGDIILSITGGGTPSKNNPQFWGGNIPWASVKDLRGSKYLQTTIDFITERGIQKSSTNLIPKGRVIICTRMGLGKIAINSINIAINQDLKAVELADEIDVNYFYNFYSTQSIVGTGVTVSGIRQSELLSFIVPIPPLNEQKRIVAKVEQLMTLCDEMEARQQKRREGCVRLNNAAIDQLLTTREPDDFSKHWQRICDNFDLLYSAPENIGKLRQAILQLAVQGKLVPQDSNDEPASSLLEKIKAEKEWLIKEGKIRRSGPLPPIEADDVPYELPPGWEWTRFPEIGEFGRGKSKHRPRNDLALYREGTYPVVQTGDVARANGTINTYTGLYNENGLAQSRLWPKGTLCITIAANIADAALLGFDACFPDSVVGFIPSSEIGQAKYFGYFMRTAKEHLQDYAPSTAQKNINLGILEKLLIPLPPKGELQRIVAKVDQLMTLCNELEAKLTQSQTNSEKLTDAAVRHTLMV